jgi:hypothetical protein
MRIGEGWSSPTHPAGRDRKPWRDAGSSADTPNAAAGGANSREATSMSIGAKWEIPASSEYRRRNLSVFDMWPLVHKFQLEFITGNIGAALLFILSR